MENYFVKISAKQKFEVRLFVAIADSLNGANSENTDKLMLIYYPDGYIFIQFISIRASGPEGSALLGVRKG